MQQPYNPNRVIPPFTSDKDEIDWRNWDIIAEVEDQKMCGSGYAHSTIANTESVYAIRSGALFKLSEQHIIDCDARNFGCSGGLQTLASKFILENGGILELDYPFTAKGGQCLQT